MNNISYDTNRLIEKGVFNYLDLHFAGFMTALGGQEIPELFLAAALASRYKRQGHVCLDLTDVAGQPLPGDIEKAVRCPPLNQWVERLSAHPAVGAPGEYKPLILDEKNRLYLYRYWEYQEELVQLIKRRSEQWMECRDAARMKDGLTRLFPEPQSKNVSKANEAGDRRIDWQKIAAFTAVCKKFCVISGGPGTGKTTTVARLLALMVEQRWPENIRIALAAPTGKAAARLQEAIRREKERLECDPAITEKIPATASTLHRLLGTLPDSPYFRFNKENRLPFHVVIVDEASMVDLALLSKLMQALDPLASLILLGDKDQLASVEAGAVLGDICAVATERAVSSCFVKTLRSVADQDVPLSPEETSPAGKTDTGIGDCVVTLKRSYRFGEESGIGLLSQAVNSGDSDEALSLVRGGRFSDIGIKEVSGTRVLKHLPDRVINGFGEYLTCKNPAEALLQFDRFRILCAHREGHSGVVDLNRRIEGILKNEGLIQPRGKWYPGRPVMITGNDYSLGLFNGDVGITLPDPETHHELRVFFMKFDGTLRKIHPQRLSEHETVFAMTVHKSQGSEFDTVLFLLPERESPVLTRELIYTAITRAKISVHVWGSETVFRSGISARINRTSGLKDSLRKA